MDPFCLSEGISTRSASVLFSILGNKDPSGKPARTLHHFLLFTASGGELATPLMMSSQFRFRFLYSGPNFSGSKPIHFWWKCSEKIKVRFANQNGTSSTSVETQYLFRLNWEPSQRWDEIPPATSGAEGEWQTSSRTSTARSPTEPEPAEFWSELFDPS